MKNHLITPHGGKLVNLLVSPEQAKQLKVESKDWKSWDLTPRQICDLGMFGPPEIRIQEVESTYSTSIGLNVHL